MCQKGPARITGSGVGKRHDVLVCLHYVKHHEIQRETLSFSAPIIMYYTQTHVCGGTSPNSHEVTICFKKSIMHDCASILDSIAKGISFVDTDFSHGVYNISHSYIPIYSVECFLHLYNFIIIGITPSPQPTSGPNDNTPHQDQSSSGTSGMYNYVHIICRLA